MMAQPHMQLAPEEWTARSIAHRERARSYTAEHLIRRKTGAKHPVFDFLFEYYPVRIAHLERWHPGFGVHLIHENNCVPPHAQWKNYATTHRSTSVDAHSFWSRRGRAMSYIENLLVSTNDNPVHFDCFGLHEWAMVYQTDQPRHDLPLRLGPKETNKVVENSAIKCTHFDAFRFFTPAARPLNFTILSREDQPRFDQRACVHAAMDLYKWATKLGPLVSGELWLDAFEIAWDARILDMEASPYDCREYGLGVVPIETPEGKAEYVARQRALSQRAVPLRNRLVAVIRETRNATLTE